MKTIKIGNASITIPNSIYALVIAFLYGIIAQFWPQWFPNIPLPVSQDVFSSIVLVILGWLGIEVSSQVTALRAELWKAGLLQK
jgi:hypothetical protein